MTCAIETYSLTKRFPTSTGWRALLARQQNNTPAVLNVNLSVTEGELFGLLGPNGAGKTTLIKMLGTLISPTSGTARVNGYYLHEDTQIRDSIGLVTNDERSFYWRLTGRQNLEFFASLHGLQPDQIDRRVQETLDEVDLENVADKRFQTFSTGMRQRLSIARALLNRPPILFLDEPTKGLDPTATNELHKLIKERLTAQEGITVLMTTHDLREAEELCDRIAIMNHGRIYACGTMVELRHELNLGERYILRVNNLENAIYNRLTEQINEIEIENIENYDSASDEIAEETSPVLIELKSEDSHKTLNDTIDILRDGNVVIQYVTREQMSLEAIFAHHISQGIEENEGQKYEVETINDTPRDNIPVSENKPHTEAKEVPTRSRNFAIVSNTRIAHAFLKRDISTELSYRFSFVLQFFGILFSVGVFFFISELLGEAAAPYLDQYGGDYFSFVLIGIAFSGYFGVGLSSFSSSIRRAQTTGTLEAMLTTPTSLSAIILSSSLWDYLLTTLRVFVYLFIGVALLGVDLQHGNYLAALIILVLTVITFSSLGIIAASFIMVLKRGDPITWVVSALSTLLGGVYYPIEILPDWMQFLARLIPVTYALEAMRLALLQGASFSTLFPDIMALIVFSIILLPMSLFSFRYAVKRAKVDGSLTHY